MRNKKHLSAFTLVELVVVATILVVLTSLGFYSYVGNLQDSRDSARLSDIAKLSSALKLSHQKRGVYPNPGQNFNITASGATVAIQGKLDRDVGLSTIDEFVVDPKLDIPYTYSITTNKQEFQIAGTLENSDNPRSILRGDYKTVSVNILPTLILATNSTEDLEITAVANRNLFVFDGGTHNVVYTFNNDNGADSDGTSFENLLSDPLIDFYQNSDFRSCIEISEAGKSLGDGEYQIRNADGVLTGTGCVGI